MQMFLFLPCLHAHCLPCHHLLLLLCSIDWCWIRWKTSRRVVRRERWLLCCFYSLAQKQTLFCKVIFFYDHQYCYFQCTGSISKEPCCFTQSGNPHWWHLECKWWLCFCKNDWPMKWTCQCFTKLWRTTVEFLGGFRHIIPTQANEKVPCWMTYQNYQNNMGKRII